MSDKKIIAVVGATGAQGGGLVRAILNDRSGGFSVRAITRDIHSDKAKALADLGAELFAADVDDPASLKAAFQGAYGAYCVTFFWAHFSPEKEMAEAKSMAEAAKAAGVRHVIWSTLEDSRKWVPLDDNRMPTLQGKYKVPHFDAKGESNHFFSDLDLPVTFLLTSFYWENFIYFGMAPKKGADGKLALTLPIGSSKFPSISAEDIGRCAYGLFKSGDAHIRKTVGIAGDHLTGDEMAATFSQALGSEVVYNGIPASVYRGFGFPGADDLGNMFQFNSEFSDYFCGARSLAFSKSINPALQNFAQWLDANKGRIPQE